jgi:hypothetical protein
MNREQAEFAEFSKQSKERKVAIEQEKNRIADEFRKNQLKKKTFQNYKEKYDNFKEAKARGLVIGKKQRTPGPTLQDLMKDGPTFAKSKGDTPANNMRGKQSISKVGVNLFDSGNSPDSGGYSSDDKYQSAKTSRKNEYEGSTGSNKSKSAVVSPVPIRYDEEPVSAEEVKEFTTDYQRFIGSESNKSFVQEHANEILTAQELLVNETGKARDVLAPDVFETLKGIKILRVTEASRADSVLHKINTLVEADKILQKGQSPFKGERRSTRNKAVHAIPIDEIPEKREEKERIMKNTVIPETMRPASASGPRK